MLAPFPGGRVWTDSWLLGDAASDFRMLIPDIRLPANQYWPLHWHDCWIAVVILDGTCLIGDWWMTAGDVLVTEAGLEYGPLVIGPSGCQMFEIFADLATQSGGYAPEYRDHPTLQGGDHAFRERSPRNRRNEGRMCLPIDAGDGMEKGQLEAGRRWNLGNPEDPGRGVMEYNAHAAGATIPAHDYGDWHAVFVMAGSVSLGGRQLRRNDVLIVGPGAVVDEMAVGPDGVEFFEASRTAAGIDGRPLV